MAKSIWTQLAGFKHPYELLMFVSFSWLLVNWQSTNLYLVYGVLLLMAYVVLWQSRAMPKFTYLSPVSGLYSFLGLKRAENAITQLFRSPTTLVGVAAAFFVCLVTTMFTSSYYAHFFLGGVGEAVRFYPTGMESLITQAIVVAPFETLTFQVFIPLTLEQWMNEARYGAPTNASQPFPLDRWTFIASIVLSQMFFAATHWRAYGGSFGGMATIFLVGMIWAPMARAYSPAAAMGAHLGYNMVFLNIVGAPAIHDAIQAVIFAVMHGAC